jgi:hypothetical protein
MRSRGFEGRNCLDGWEALALLEQEFLDAVLSDGGLAKHDDSMILHDTLLWSAKSLYIRVKQCHYIVLKS